MMVQMLLLAVGFVVFDGDGMVGRHDVDDDGVGVAVLLTALCLCVLRLSYLSRRCCGRPAGWRRGDLSQQQLLLVEIVKRKKRREQKKM